MPRLCVYFNVHQPYRLRPFRASEVGTGADYFDDGGARTVLRQVAERCYLPANERLMRLIRESRGEFRVAMSLSGVLLDQLQAHAPDALASFRSLVATGAVELLGETYYHSLAALADPCEFIEQVQRHDVLLQILFARRPRVFRNTELIYSDALAPLITELGFRGVLVEGAAAALGGRSPNYVYEATGAPCLRLLPRHPQLSSDIAVRLSDRSWGGWPLTAEKLVGWIAHSPGDCVNLFLDYETFGDYQRAETGIFELLERLPAECARRGICFVQPTELITQPARAPLSFPTPTPWVDDGEDLGAWLGNRLQQTAHERLYRMRGAIEARRGADRLENWRRLTTSDHFYHMSTRRSSSAETRAYLNPHATPYQAFVHYMNVLQDLEQDGAATSALALSGDEHYLAGMAVAG